MSVISFWTIEHRWELGKPDEFFCRVYWQNGKWEFQFYECDGEFVDEAEGGGYVTAAEAMQAAEDWYREYTMPTPSDEFID